jgi:acetyltransferase-like isoleucine patch superfamily enzyme
MARPDDPAPPLTPEQFLALLREVRQAADARLKQQYDRSLPLGDALFDRWERARQLGFEDGANIYDSALVYGDVSVGRNTWVGPYTLLDGSGGGVKIGAFCSISTGVHIYTHDTVLWALSGGKAPRHTAPVEIGDCCYIGSQSVIAAGVKIGRQSVVAANSFVNRDVPERSIVGGSPARPIGTVIVDGETITLSMASSSEP